MQNQVIIDIMNRYGIRGKDTALMLAVEKAYKVAQYDVPVLILGENGTGKEVFHKILHDGSHRRNSKCLAINCGGLPEDTITSELFGHVKGAYTGSVGDRKGYFEEADGGTLFLDEIGELPLTVQAKLLRVLQNGEVIRMGSNEVRHVDVRIVAATNVDLQKAIREGRFRQDLYYRLSTVSIHIPALRERGDDAVLLFRYFATEVSRRYGMPNKIELADEECRMMVRGYHWPGNVRQLLHIVEEMSITEAENPRITASVLRHYLPPSGAVSTDNPLKNATSDELNLMKMAIYELKTELDEVRAKLGMQSGKKHAIAALPPSGSTAFKSETYKPEVFDAAEETEAVEITPIQPGNEVHWHPAEDISQATTPVTAQHSRPRTMDEIQCEAIREALQRNGGNKRKAAEELNISERTIHRKIQDFGLN